MERKPGERTAVRRLPERARYDREAIYGILDEGLVAHVGIVAEGQPYVIPMGYGRDGDSLILHGAVASRLLRTLKKGVPACATVTLLDGLVLARSAFHSSMNYRSVCVLGTATAVTDPEEKASALRVLTEHLIPGRWADARHPSEKEAALTAVLRLPLEEASAKMRTGPPKDEEEDYSMPVWAGVIPFAPAAGAPEADPELAPGIEPPSYVTDYRRPGG